MVVCIIKKKTRKRKKMKCDKCGRWTGDATRVEIDGEIFHYCLDCNDELQDKDALVKINGIEKPDKVRFEASPQMAGKDRNDDIVLKFNIPKQKQLDFDISFTYYIIAYKKKPDWW